MHSKLSISLGQWRESDLYLRRLWSLANSRIFHYRALKWFLSRSATKIADDAVQSKRLRLVIRARASTLNSLSFLILTVFGGRGITVGGMGNLIEQFNRTFKFDSILGGSEEYVHQLDAATIVCLVLNWCVRFYRVLLDLSARQALKKMPKAG